MAWTPSTPQRGAIAAVTALVGGQRKIGRATTIFGKSDAVKGQTIAIAAWLGIAGAAAPNIPPMAMMALLCATGALLLLFVALPSQVDETYRDGEAISRRSISEVDCASRSSQPTAVCLQELITVAPDRVTVTDRAAFARLTAHMSHELRTPLNAILGFSELMSNEVFGPLGSSSYAGYARDIHASGLSLLKSAEDALAITALLTAPEKASSLASSNVATAAREALAFQASAFATRDLRVSCTIDAETEILCDPQTTRQLLINLLDDASSRAATGATIAIASRDIGNEFEVLITVTDTVPAEPAADNFSMLLARTLAELAGARLGESTCGGDRQTTARFTRSAQHELFAPSNV